MEMQLTNHEADFASVQFAFGTDDPIDLSGYGNNVKLTLTFYDHEGGELIELLRQLVELETQLLPAERTVIRTLIEHTLTPSVSTPALTDGDRELLARALERLAEPEL